MKLHNVFIDGAEGTTGLQISDRLAKRGDICLLEIPANLRKDVSERLEYMRKSDVTILCLPDAAAIEAVKLADSSVRILDASTAHRTKPGWAYGFPELGESFVSQIASGNRVSVPGCHACGFIAIMYPLVAGGIISKDFKSTCFSLTGYSGGGKSMIGDYESFDRSNVISPQIYAREGNHKHLNEMVTISGLVHKPVFSPIVCDYYSGMIVTVPFFIEDFDGRNVDDVREHLANYYTSKGSKVRVASIHECELQKGKLVCDM
ncbi:MAG: N-acetyl-gamma-glutamyl-phosphate reductase, partial [Christensenellaceae bacterium]|nr:N-acetyl-gamma-glutamyl-phosphate reductase [Christensenellaceae bacterium]